VTGHYDFMRSPWFLLCLADYVVRRLSSLVSVRSRKPFGLSLCNCETNETDDEEIQGQVVALAKTIKECDRQCRSSSAICCRSPNEPYAPPY